jgi:hypothetical protein
MGHRRESKTRTRVVIVVVVIIVTDVTARRLLGQAHIGNVVKPAAGGTLHAIFDAVIANSEEFALAHVGHYLAVGRILATIENLRHTWSDNAG